MLTPVIAALSRNPVKKPAQCPDPIGWVASHSGLEPESSLKTPTKEHCT